MKTKKFVNIVKKRSKNEKLKTFLTNNDQYYANNLHDEILSMANNIDQIKNEMQQIKQFVNR